MRAKKIQRQELVQNLQAIDNHGNRLQGPIRDLVETHANEGPKAATSIISQEAGPREW